MLQILGDSCSLRKPLLKAHVENSGQLADPQAIHPERYKSDTKYQDQPNPPRLPDCWFHFKPNHSFGTIPQPVAVRSHDAKAVWARAEIRVYGGLYRRRIAPTAIKTIETITILNTLRIGEIQPRVAERDPLARGRKADWNLTIDRSAIHH